MILKSFSTLILKKQQPLETVPLSSIIQQYKEQLIKSGYSLSSVTWNLQIRILDNHRYDEQVQAARQQVHLMHQQVKLLGERMIVD